MTIDSMRQARRRAALALLIKEVGGVSALALLTGTPKSHFSAMTAGRRGCGDELADKLERAMGRPAGWMDRDLSQSSVTLTPRAIRIAALWDSMPEGSEKERVYTVSVAMPPRSNLRRSPQTR